MREAIGSTMLYNIIFIFIAIMFMFIMSTLIYHRSFKINKSILSIIEKYEGFNLCNPAAGDFTHMCAQEEVRRALISIGYSMRHNVSCPENFNGGTLHFPTPDMASVGYCIYFFPQDPPGDLTHYSYGVTTFITIDFPIINNFVRIPIHTRSNRIYRFNTPNPAPID